MAAGYKSLCFESTLSQKWHLSRASYSMTSHLVPTVLNFTGNHITAALPRTEPCTRPQNPSSSSTHSSIVPGTQSAAIELGEQSRQRALLTEEPDVDEHELKLPKMRSLVVMICANMLLQVRTY